MKKQTTFINSFENKRLVLLLLAFREVVHRIVKRNVGQVLPGFGAVMKKCANAIGGCKTRA